MVRPEDFAKCCRCCLLTLGPMNSIFGTCLDTMLAQLTGLPVVKNDGYPEQMCSRCVIKLSSAYNFYSSVKSNHRALEEVLKAVTDKPEQLSTYQESKVENKLVTQIDTTAASLKTVKNDPKSKASRQLSLTEPESQPEELSDPEECYQCLQCNHNSQSEDDLKIHLQTHVPNTPSNSEHLEAAKQLCSYCGKKFRLRTSLCKHLRLHRGDFFECKYCDKRFVEASTLKVHLVSHNLVNPKRFRCACGRVFAQRSSLRKHARAHGARARHACADCGKSFLHKFSLGKHRARTHAPAQCARCDQLFTGTKALNVHMKTHNRNSLKITGSTTEAATTNYALTDPVSVQAVTVEFLCLLCSGKYPDKESLEVHLCSRENVT